MAKPMTMGDLSLQPTGWLTDRPPGVWQIRIFAAAAVAVYLAGVTGVWCPTPDSSGYLGLGRSLAEGKGYVFNGRVPTNAAPVLPLALAGLRTLFGPGCFAPNLLMALCGLAGLWLIYATVRRMSDRRIALAVAICTGASYNFYYHSHLILTDAPFLAFFWLLLYACVRTKSGGWGWAAMAAGATVAGAFTRAPGLLAIGILSLGLFAERAGSGWPGRVRRTAPVLLAALGAGGALLTLSRLAAGQTPGYLNATMKGISGATVGQRVMMFLEGLWNLIFTLSEALTGQDGLPMLPVGALALGLAAVGGVVAWRNGQRFVPVVTFGVAIAGSALYGRVGTLPRILLSVLPLFLYQAIQGACAVLNRLLAAAPEPRRSKAMLVAVAAIACISFANLPRVLYDAVYLSYLSRTGRYYQVLRGGEHMESMVAAEFLAKNVRPGMTLVGVAAVPILHYLSGCVIVEPALDPFSPFATPPDLADFARRTNADMVITRVGRKGAAEADARLDASLVRLGMHRVFLGKTLRIYERLSPPAKAAGGAQTRDATTVPGDSPQ